jgi:hypothetical protein
MGGHTGKFYLQLPVLKATAFKPNASAFFQQLVGNSTFFVFRVLADACAATVVSAWSALANAVTSIACEVDIPHLRGLAKK